MPVAPPKPQGLSQSQRRFAARAIQEIANRGMEALKCYQPVPDAEAFHQSDARLRLLIGGNRSGKTSTAVAEAGMIAMGVHPYNEHPKTDGLIYAVGYDWKHVGKVMAAKLLQPGMFYIIRDEETREWRPVVPDNEYDAAYREKWQEAAPVIPPREIKSISWESRKDRLPKAIRLKNDWEVQFYSSLGDPQAGTAINFWWIDEEVQNRDWPDQLVKRVGTGGKRAQGIYSATPEISLPWLHTQYRRSQAFNNDPKALQSFKLLMKDNPFFSTAEKKEFFDGLLTERQRKIAWYGDFTLDERMVYATFDEDLHTVKNFSIPRDWCRAMIVDPGVQKCGVLFMALAPDYTLAEKPHPNRGEVHVWYEQVIEQCHARKFAEVVNSAMGPDTRGGFMWFLVDDSYGRQGTASGRSNTEEYSLALMSKDIFSQGTASGFIKGEKKSHIREEKLRRLMDPNPFNPDGVPRLRIHSNCQRLPVQIKDAFYDPKKDGDQRKYDPHDHNDLLMCLEYGASFLADVIYQKPKPPQRPLTAKDERMKKLSRKNKARRSVSIS